MQGTEQSKDCIALFGGTGYVGARLCELLLASDYRVRLLVRDAQRATDLATDNRIEVVVGHLGDQQAVAETVQGSRAVLVTTGARSQKHSDMREIVQGTRNIITAMTDLRVGRLIKLSGTSVRIAGEPFPLMRRLLDIALRIAMPYPTKSKYLEHQDIMASNLEWVIVRPPVIDAGEIQGEFCAHASDHLGLKVARDDLCRFIIAQITSEQWLRACPVVGYR